MGRTDLTRVAASSMFGVAFRRSGLARMDRITIDSTVMGGVPCVRGGLRIPVATLVNTVGEIPLQPTA